MAYRLSTAVISRSLRKASRIMVVAVAVTAAAYLLVAYVALPWLWLADETRHHPALDISPAQLHRVEADGGEGVALVFGFQQDALLELGPLGGREGAVGVEPFPKAGPGEQRVAEVALEVARNGRKRLR